jgi:hypothetical protein
MKDMKLSQCIKNTAGVIYDGSLLFGIVILPYNCKLYAHNTKIKIADNLVELSN